MGVNDNVIKLRPHHLLCTQGYSGKGYSEGFVDNMSTVVDRLRNGNDEIQIVFNTDNICRSCPEKLGENLCKSQEKVLRYDSKVVKYFGIEEKNYHYREIIKEIDSKMTGEMMDDICGDCGWYPISACKRNIVKNSDLESE